MWKCPKCGREFKNQDQGHYCLKPENIDEYIVSQDELARPYLQAVREAIHRAIPEAQERISWSVPTFWDGRNVIQFAASKKHLGLYPGPEAVEHFEDRLADYKTSKGTIRLPYRDPFPLDLVADIARWCWEQYKR